MKHSRTKTLTVILPTYNESGNIIRLIREIKRTTADSGWTVYIHVVDDDSPDRTGILVRKTFADDPSVRVSIRKRERGLATAILMGIRRAETTYLLFMDADFNHHPRYIPEMLKRVEADRRLVISGSRYISGGGMDERERFIGSQFINDAMKLVLGMPITDYLSGFLLVRLKTLNSLPLRWIFRGFGEWSLRLHVLLRRQNLIVKEIAVHYPARTYGKTKMNPFSYAARLALTLAEVRFFLPRS